MAQTETGTTNFDKMVQLLLNKRLQERLRAPKPYLAPGNFIPAEHVAGSSGTMRFLNVPDVVVDDAEVTASLVVTEGSPNTAAAIGFGYEEFATRQRMKTFKFTDRALLQAPIALLSEGAKVLAEYVLNLGDRIASIAIAAGTNVIYSGTGNAATGDVAAGDVLLSYDVKHAGALLEGSNVPMFPDGTYHAEMHPYVKFDVSLDDDAGGWVDAQRYAAPGTLLQGELGRYANVRFTSSSNARIKSAAGAGGIDVYSTTIHGPRFFAVGDWGNNETFYTAPGGHDDPGHQSALITWKGWMDCAVVGEMTNATNVTEPRYIRIESAASI